jgi:hypothetical protein
MAFHHLRGENQGKPLGAEQPEGNGEDEKEPVAGLAPEPQKKESRHGVPHYNRARNQIRHSHHSVSQTRP